MKLEAGKRYVRRDGVVVGPLIENSNMLYSFRCGRDSWTEEGLYSATGAGSQHDLIAEHIEPPKFEAGKSYKMRCGRRFDVLLVAEKVFGIVTEASGCRYAADRHLDGRLYERPFGESEVDLIAPWTEQPVVPWEKYPEWVKCVAQHEKDDWFAFSHDPVPTETGWRNPTNEFAVCRIVPTHLKPIFAGDWRESKVARPCENV